MNLFHSNIINIYGRKGKVWAWVLEDGCDARYFEQLTKIFDRINMNSED